MSKINHALIMAAGRGSRMMPLTDSIPKAMAKFGSSTLILNGINKVRKRIKNIHITVGYKKSDLAKYVIENDVSTVINTQGQGNSWWIFNSLLKNIDEPVFVLTCDNIIDLDFEILEKDYFEQGAPACMVVPVIPVPGLEGDYIHEEDNFVKELNREKESEKYCSGIQIINPAKINKIVSREDDFNKLWLKLIELKELKCSKIYPSKWYTVDTMEQLEKINDKYS